MGYGKGNKTSSIGKKGGSRTFGCKNMDKTVISFLEELTNIFQELIQKLMFWVFDFFSSNGFVPTLSTIRLSTSSFFVLFTDTETSTNIFNSLLNNVILPASIGIVIILISFSLYKSIVSDKETESAMKIFMRAGISLLLVISIIQIMHVLLSAGGTVQNLINNAITSSFGGINEDTAQNLNTAAGEVMGSEIDGVSSISDSLKGLGTALVAAVLCVILTWKYFKLVLQYLSRYVRVYMLTVFAPLASAAKASESSEEIFNSYIRMYVGCLISVAISQALLLSTKFACSVTLNAGQLRLLILYYCLTLSYFSFAEEIDTYLDKLKLNIAGNTKPMMTSMFGRLAQTWATGMLAKGGAHVVGKAMGAATSAAAIPLQGAVKAVQNAGANASAGTLLKGAGKAAEGMTGKKTNIPTTDKKALENATKDMRQQSMSHVSALGTDNKVSGTISQKNGKYEVEKSLGAAAGNTMEEKLANAMDMAGSNVKGDINSANILGANGSHYNISKSVDKDGLASFGIKDTDHGISLATSGISNWQDAVNAVSAASGGIAGDSEFYGSTGEVFRTSSDGGDMNVSQNAGSYETSAEAVSRAESFLDTGGGYRVSNGLGYSSQPVDASQVGSEMSKAETTMVSFSRNDGRQFTGALHPDGSISVYDRKSNQDMKFQDINSFASLNHIDSVSFYGNGSYTGSNGSDILRQQAAKNARKSFFDRK